MIINEQILHRMIVENPESFLKGLRVVKSEVPLYPAYDLLTNETYDQENTSKPFGRIDLILEHKRGTYITEIKFKEPNHTSSDFWDSLKVLGYEKYYRWQYNVKYKTRPAIIVPKHSIKLEQQIIAGTLGLTVFAVNISNQRVWLQKLDDRPIWKQG